MYIYTYIYICMYVCMYVCMYYSLLKIKFFSSARITINKSKLINKNVKSYN
ncbi:MAG: hypothetical protein NW900_01780 [Candidatus Blochmannia sp. A2]|nr:hypothetical protein [Candidatus Blochmannia sp. A2]